MHLIYDKVLLSRTDGSAGEVISTHGIYQAEVSSVDVAISGSVDTKACVFPDKGNFLENKRTEGC